MIRNTTSQCAVYLLSLLVVCLNLETSALSMPKEVGVSGGGMIVKSTGTDSDRFMQSSNAQFKNPLKLISWRSFALVTTTGFLILQQTLPLFAQSVSTDPSKRKFDLSDLVIEQGANDAVDRLFGQTFEQVHEDAEFSEIMTHVLESGWEPRKRALDVSMKKGAARAEIFTAFKAVLNYTNNQNIALDNNTVLPVIPNTGDLENLSLTLKAELSVDLFIRKGIKDAEVRLARYSEQAGNAQLIIDSHDLYKNLRLKWLNLNRQEVNLLAKEALLELATKNLKGDEGSERVAKLSREVIDLKAAMRTTTAEIAEDYAKFAVLTGKLLPRIITRVVGGVDPLSSDDSLEKLKAAKEIGPLEVIKVYRELLGNPDAVNNYLALIAREYSNVIEIPENALEATKYAFGSTGVDALREVESIASGAKKRTEFWSRFYGRVEYITQVTSISFGDWNQQDLSFSLGIALDADILAGGNRQAAQAALEKARIDIEQAIATAGSALGGIYTVLETNEVAIATETNNLTTTHPQLVSALDQILAGQLDNPTLYKTLSSSQDTYQNVMFALTEALLNNIHIRFQILNVMTGEPSKLIPRFQFVEEIRREINEIDPSEIEKN